jgi:hypothetical protein
MGARTGQTAADNRAGRPEDPDFCGERRTNKASFVRGNELHDSQLKTTLPDCPDFMTSNPFSNSV